MRRYNWAAGLALMFVVFGMGGQLEGQEAKPAEPPVSTLKFERADRYPIVEF